jgi:hypothetical protein
MQNLFKTFASYKLQLILACNIQPVRTASRLEMDTNIPAALQQTSNESILILC